MCRLRAIWYSFLYETSRKMVFLFSVFCGVPAATIYFDRMLGVGLISLLAIVPFGCVGLIYMISFMLLHKFSGAKVSCFSINGNNYYVTEGTSTLKNRGGAGLVALIIYSIFALPIYIFEITVRIVLSIVSKRYRESIDEYYENNSTEMFDRLKWGGCFSIGCIFILCCMFGLMAWEKKIYDPKKFVIENVSVEYYSNSLGRGKYLQFDYRSTSKKIVALYSDYSDGTTFYIESPEGKIVYELKKNIILETWREPNTEKIFFDYDFSPKCLQDGYKIYLVFNQLEAKGIIQTGRMDIDYVVRVL